MKNKPQAINLQQQKRDGMDLSVADELSVGPSGLTSLCKSQGAAWRLRGQCDAE